MVAPILDVRSPALEAGDALVRSPANQKNTRIGVGEVVPTIEGTAADVASDLAVMLAAGDPSTPR